MVIAKCKNVVLRKEYKEYSEKIQYIIHTTNMSTSLAAAKKRRAPASAQVPTPSYPGQQSGVGVAPSTQSQPQGLTLPQVISLVDKRLLALESTVKGMKESSTGDESAQVPSNITEVFDEFNSRFENLAEEIENLKNIVLSLQSYTMDVNKMLLEERVQLLGGNASESANEQQSQSHIATF